MLNCASGMMRDPGAVQILILLIRESFVLVLYQRIVESAGSNLTNGIMASRTQHFFVFFFQILNLDF